MKKNIGTTRIALALAVLLAILACSGTVPTPAPPPTSTPVLDFANSGTVTTNWWPFVIAMLPVLLLLVAIIIRYFQQDKKSGWGKRRGKLRN